MPPKQYQRDPDSDEDQPNEVEPDTFEGVKPTFEKSKTKDGVEGVKPTFEKSKTKDGVEGVKPLVKPLRGHPKGTKNKKRAVYVEPEKIVEMVQNNELKLTKSQQKALLPKRTRTINDKERQRLIEMGKKGREAMIANKAKRDEEKLHKQDEERKRQELINAKKIRVERPERKKRQPLNTFKKSVTKDEVKEEEYESDSDDSEGYSTDTRTIKKVSKKIKQINQVLQPIPQQQPIQRSYKELSLLDKLNLRF